MTTVQQLSKQFSLLTDWYTSVLENLKPEDGSKVLSANTNSLEWLAGHLLVVRNRNTARLGRQVAPFRHLDSFVDPALAPPNFRPFDARRTYPSLADCAAAWAAYSAEFIDALETADARVLQAAIPLSGPTGGNTVEALLISNVLHEAFHIGQMSVIRKALGYPAMYWFPRPDERREQL